MTSVRHCAFCLSLLTPEKVKLCGSCRRRAYCSKQCQRSDWSPKFKKKTPDKGQGHKDWCSLNCCEEDLDWIVSRVPGKGLGLIATKFIPAKSKLIVESPCPLSHPGFQDLEPKDGTIQDKIRLNQLGVIGSNEAIVCLRISRANHSCDPNASHFFEESFQVKILYLEREIEAGEEICINYQPLLAFSDRIFEDLEYRRYTLGLKWDIVCPDDCLCRKPGMEKLIEDCKRLDSERFNEDQAAGLNAVKLLLDKQRAVKSSLLLRQRTLVSGFEIAIRSHASLEEGMEFIREACHILNCISSPKSVEYVKCEGFMNNPGSHENYLLNS